jgi:hypothetical protein
VIIFVLLYLTFRRFSEAALIAPTLPRDLLIRTRAAMVLKMELSPRSFDYSRPKSASDAIVGDVEFCALAGSIDKSSIDCRPTCIRAALRRSLHPVRVFSIVLAVMLWLTPTVQAFAGFSSEAHCRTHGHLLMLAADRAHGDVSTQQDQPSGHHHHISGGPHHAAGNGSHCKCGCLCGLACAESPAVATSLPVAAVPVHGPWSLAVPAGHPALIPALLLRPPSFLS